MKAKKKKISKAQAKGRPVIPIDWKIVENLLQADCSGVQVAAYIGISEDTLYGRVKKEKGMIFSTYRQLNKIPKVKEKKEVNHKHKYQINTWDKNGYYIYVIQHGETNLFKIGISKLKIKDRIQCLQVGNPIPLRCILINYTNNASKIETEIHQLFKKKNMNGEWFNLSDSDMVLIKSKIKELDSKLNQLKLF
jgi:hypothetical protein